MSSLWRSAPRGLLAFSVFLVVLSMENGIFEKLTTLCVLFYLFGVVSELMERSHERSRWQPMTQGFILNRQATIYIFCAATLWIYYVYLDVVGGVVALSPTAPALSESFKTTTTTTTTTTTKIGGDDHNVGVIWQTFFGITVLRHGIIPFIAALVKRVLMVGAFRRYADLPHFTSWVPWLAEQMIRRSVNTFLLNAIWTLEIGIMSWCVTPLLTENQMLAAGLIAFVWIALCWFLLAEAIQSIFLLSGAKLDNPADPLFVMISGPMIQQNPELVDMLGRVRAKLSAARVRFQQPLVVAFSSQKQTGCKVKGEVINGSKAVLWVSTSSCNDHDRDIMFSMEMQIFSAAVLYSDAFWYRRLLQLVRFLIVLAETAILVWCILLCTNNPDPAASIVPLHPPWFTSFFVSPFFSGSLLENVQGRFDSMPVLFGFVLSVPLFVMANYIFQVLKRALHLYYCLKADQWIQHCPSPALSPALSDSSSSSIASSPPSSSSSSPSTSYGSMLATCLSFQIQCSAFNARSPLYYVLCPKFVWVSNNALSLSASIRLRALSSASSSSSCST